MKIRIDLTANMLDMYDEPFYRDSEKKNKLTMKDVIMSSLLTPDTPKQGEKVDQKKSFDTYLLYARVKKELTNIDLDNEELVHIKEAIGEHQNRIVMGQAWEILEKGKQVPDKEDKKTDKK